LACTVLWCMFAQSLSLLQSWQLIQPTLQPPAVGALFTACLLAVTAALTESKFLVFSWFAALSTFIVLLQVGGYAENHHWLRRYSGLVGAAVEVGFVLGWLNTLGICRRALRATDVSMARRPSLDPSVSARVADFLFVSAESGSDLEDPLLGEGVFENLGYKQQNGWGNRQDGAGTLVRRPSLAEAHRVTDTGDLTDDEAKCVNEIKSILKAKGLWEQTDWTLHRLLQVAWCRQLQAAAGVKVYENCVSQSQKLGLRTIPEPNVKSAYRAGFCAFAGRDRNGRQLVWVRMRYCRVREIGVKLAVKNTWMCLDAAVQDPDTVRNGLTFVYDFNGLGPANITANVFDIKTTLVAVGLSHPSQIREVVFLNCPSLFYSAWRVGSKALPGALANLITFWPVSTKTPGWHDKLCLQDDLPGYLGGATVDASADSYYDWLCGRLRNWDLPYRPKDADLEDP